MIQTFKTLNSSSTTPSTRSSTRNELQLTSFLIQKGVIQYKYRKREERVMANMLKSFKELDESKDKSKDLDAEQKHETSIRIETKTDGDATTFGTNSQKSSSNMEMLFCRALKVLSTFFNHAKNVEVEIFGSHKKENKMQRVILLQRKLLKHRLLLVEEKVHEIGNWLNDAQTFIRHQQKIQRMLVIVENWNGCNVFEEEVQMCDE